MHGLLKRVGAQPSYADCACALLSIIEVTLQHTFKYQLNSYGAFPLDQSTVAYYYYPIRNHHIYFPSPKWLAASQAHAQSALKGCGMGPRLVLVSPCFRENIVATCKIGSFLCSLDNSPHKNVIDLFFGNQISKWHSFEKKATFDLLFTFSSHQGKSYKNSFSTYLKHIHTHILLTLLTSFALPI